MPMSAREREQRRRAYRRRRRLVMAGAVLVLALLAALAVWLISLGLRSLGGHGEEEPVTATTAGTEATTTTTTYPTLEAEEVGAQMHVRGVLLYDATHDAVLYSAHADEILYPASLTKLMTAAVVCKYVTADTLFTVGNEVELAAWDASSAYLQQGTTLTVSELLDALLMRSGADAAYCLAVNTARMHEGDFSLSNEDAVKRFVEYMNETAVEIGTKQTFFVTPDGYHDMYHFTTAQDMLKIALYADSFPMIHRCVSQADAGGYQNSNLLLQADSPYYYPAAVGMKTGFTDEAGYCLAASAEKDGVRLYAILLSGADAEERYVDAQVLFDRGFELAGVSVATVPAAVEPPTE